mmetsp:Transcript_2099/g.5264  ORF Transcript_2099/g.5264 Transcript_2099/m.5264 type:complete len:93 (+) Transcript_2099:233-511(+)
MLSLVSQLALQLLRLILVCGPPPCWSRTWHTDILIFCSFWCQRGRKLLVLLLERKLGAPLLLAPPVLILHLHRQLEELRESPRASAHQEHEW